MRYTSYLPLPIVRAFNRLLRSCDPWPFLPFRVRVAIERTGLACLVCPLLTSATRSETIARPSANFRGTPLPQARRRPPLVSSTAFPATLPDLRPVSLMDMDFAKLPARPTPVASYLISVRQGAGLPQASFRPHLTMTPLPLG